jgi:hypothetical protein
LAITVIVDAVADFGNGCDFAEASTPSTCDATLGASFADADTFGFGVG